MNNEEFLDQDFEDVLKKDDEKDPNNSSIDIPPRKLFEVNTGINNNLNLYRDLSKNISIKDVNYFGQIQLSFHLFKFIFTKESKISILNDIF